MHVQQGLVKHASVGGICWKVSHKVVNRSQCNPTQGVDAAPPICRWRAPSARSWLSLLPHLTLARIHSRLEPSLERLPRRCGQSSATFEPTPFSVATHEESQSVPAKPRVHAKSFEQWHPVALREKVSQVQFAFRGGLSGTYFESLLLHSSPRYQVGVSAYLHRECSLAQSLNRAQWHLAHRH